MRPENVGGSRGFICTLNTPEFISSLRTDPALDGAAPAGTPGDRERWEPLEERDSDLCRLRWSAGCDCARLLRGGAGSAMISLA